MKNCVAALVVLFPLVAGCTVFRRPSPDYELPGRVPRVRRVPPRTEPQPPFRPRYAPGRIVIDPGHGGRDLGASYGGVHEKAVNLDIATKLAAELRAQRMHVTMTRTTDSFVTLERRSEIANRSGADLFVSIHANAARNRAASGIEIFYIAETFTETSGRYDDDARAWELNARNSGGTVTSADLGRWRDDSRALATHIEDVLVSRLGVASRGVKPQKYAVLRWTCSPALLVEVGFLSNANDRSRLATFAYRTQLARAIAGGILSYRRSQDRTRAMSR